MVLSGQFKDLSTAFPSTETGSACIFLFIYFLLNHGANEQSDWWFFACMYILVKKDTLPFSLFLQMCLHFSLFLMESGLPSPFSCWFCFIFAFIVWRYFETGMLLKPTVPGLCAMLQTIYETESCFSSDSTSSRERPVELLPQSRSTSMPSTGELEREITG